MKPQINIPTKSINSFCRKWKVNEFALFGSVLRKDFGPDSDIDVLIEFEPGAKVGLIRLGGMHLELSEIFGRPVDLRTPADLSRYFREDVVKSAVVQYASG